MNPNYIEKLSFKVWQTNVGVQKTNGSTLETFKMVIADF